MPPTETTTKVVSSPDDDDHDADDNSRSYVLTKQLPCMSPIDGSAVIARQLKDNNLVLVTKICDIKASATVDGKQTVAIRI